MFPSWFGEQAERERDGQAQGWTLQCVPVHAPHDGWDMANLLCAMRVFGEEGPSLAQCSDFRQHWRYPAGFAIEEVRPPEWGTETALARVTRAAARSAAIEGDYLFKEYGVRRILFSPHSIVRTPRRIHARGHLSIWQDGAFQAIGYRDLVPTRFLDEFPIQARRDEYIGVSGDVDWLTPVSLRARLNPDLSEMARQALCQEFRLKEGAMQHSEIALTIRKAMVYYYKNHVFDRTIGENHAPIWVVYFNK